MLVADRSLALKILAEDVHVGRVRLEPTWIEANMRHCASVREKIWKIAAA